jgi:hypothetical protein
VTTTTEVPPPPPSRRVPRPRPEPAPARAAPETSTATRPCAGCGETILAVANKCRFCGAWLDVADEKAHRDARRAASRPPIGPAGRAAGVLAMLHIVPLGVCTFSHTCMDGHLAHEVTATALAIDAAWVVLLLGAAGAWCFVTARRHPVRAMFAVATVGFHLGIGSRLSPIDIIPAIVLALLGAADVVRSFAGPSPAPG